MVAATTDIVRRRVQIDFAAVPPGPWFPGGGRLETLINAASLSFPLAERFAMAAVAAYRTRIHDAVLLKQMAGFMHQEAMHDRVHVACNDMLARHNPRSVRATRISEAVFGFLSRTPRAFRLSVSAGMEHVAALLAEVVLQHADDLHAVLPTPVADLWVWHAIEETEHKAVCFDVYAAGVGKKPLAYINRVLGMLVATPVFLLVMLAMGAAAQGSPQPGKASQPAPPSDAPADERFAGRSVLGVLRSLIPWRQYFAYYRPSFHPWEHDNSHLVANWKARNPHFGLAPEGATSVDQGPAPGFTAAPVGA